MRRRDFAETPIRGSSGLPAPKRSGIEIGHLVHTRFDFAQGRLRSFDLC
jgi:hypothetical protein